MSVITAADSELLASLLVKQQKLERTIVEKDRQIIEEE